MKKKRRQFSKFLFPPLNVFNQNVLRYNTNMPLTVKIFHIYINYLMYKPLLTDKRNATSKSGIKFKIFNHWLNIASDDFTYLLKVMINLLSQGAQWLSGRVLDSRPRGRGLEPHRRHCVVVLEQDTFILA